LRFTLVARGTYEERGNSAHANECSLSHPYSRSSLRQNHRFRRSRATPERGRRHRRRAGQRFQFSCSATSSSLTCRITRSVGAFSRDLPTRGHTDAGSRAIVALRWSQHRAGHAILPGRLRPPDEARIAPANVATGPIRLEQKALLPPSASPRRSYRW
jgi:hypothetical protein